MEEISFGPFRNFDDFMQWYLNGRAWKYFHCEGGLENEELKLADKISDDVAKDVGAICGQASVVQILSPYFNVDYIDAIIKLYDGISLRERMRRILKNLQLISEYLDYPLPE